jgi:hypothetical protein
MGPRFGVPSPGKPTPPLSAPTDGIETYGVPLSMDAELIRRDERAPACASSAVRSTATFRPIDATDRGDLRVLVECAEFLHPHATYRLALGRAQEVPDGENKSLWRGVEVDELATDMPQR